MKKTLFNSENQFIPDVGTSYSIGWNLMFHYFVELLLLVVISIVVQIPIQIMTHSPDIYNFPSNVFMILFVIVFGFAVGTPVSYGVDYVYLKLVRGQEFNVSDVFVGFRENYLNVVLSSVLVMVIVLLGFVLLIIPGIIFSCKLAFVPYLVLDKKMEAVEAVKASWEMTNGHTVTIFLMLLLAIPIIILGLVMLIVGIIPAIMWVSGASAAIYHSVDLLNKPPEEVLIENVKSE